MSIDITIPSVGESVTEVIIDEWLVAEGVWVEADTALVSIETDKANVEISAPVGGTLSKIIKANGDPASVGDIIGQMEEQAKPEGLDENKEEKAAEPAQAPEAPKAPPAPEAPSGPRPEPRVMPAASRLAASKGIDPKTVEGTGPGSRVLKEDVQRATSSATPPPIPPAAVTPAPKPAAAKSTPVEAGDGEEVVRMTPLRKTIARRLVEAQQTAAILTTFNEIDMSAVMAMRKRHQEAFVAKYGIKLGFMSFFVKASIEALKAVPEINAEIRGDSIVYKNYFNIGVAVGGPKGLVVPVIKNAERLSFAEVEQSISDFGARAQSGKILPDDMRGGTFTISNGGVFGSLLSTPILNPPQSGILGMHSIQQRPVGVNGEIVLRPMMYVALSYDHRIVDGRGAVTFLKHIKDCVETPERVLLEI